MITPSNRQHSALDRPTLITADLSDLYNQDYAQWLDITVAQLRSGQFASVDLVNLVEELESMGRSEKRALSSNLQIVLMHLLKYRYQPEKRSHSWLFTLYEHRDRLLEILEDSPSLQSYLNETFTQSYAKARKKAALETGLPIDTFPEAVPFALESVLDVDYLPSSDS